MFKLSKLYTAVSYGAILFLLTSTTLVNAQGQPKEIESRRDLVLQRVKYSLWLGSLSKPYRIHNETNIKIDYATLEKAIEKKHYLPEELLIPLQKI